jgi:WD40 repeat protein
VEFWQNFTLNSCISKTTRILDFDFNYFQENLSVVSSAESVTLIDSRVPKQPSNSLPLLFGASQAKFSPATEYLLYTAHVSDIRCFDIRNARAPCRQFVASSHKRQILSMALHPTDSNILVSSSSSESKLWNCSDSNAQPYHLDHSNIGKFAFCVSFKGLQLTPDSCFFRTMENYLSV